MQLRDYQENAISLARDSIRRGLKRPVLALPAGSGKTAIAGQMLKNCQDVGKKGWFFCDRIQLIEQTIVAFKKFGIDFGVRQSSHELANAQAPIQIASIQTMAAMIGKHGKNIPEFDMCVVDEAHVSYAVIDLIMEKYNNIPIIGLTATPYSKGMGLKYNNLLVPITTRELLDRGYLSPIKYFGGEHVDLSKVRSIDPNTYSAQDLEAVTDSDSDRLAGCIIKNWFKLGEDPQTIAFSPTQALSRNLVDRFNKNGISAEHVDCNFSQDDRQDLFEAHDKGEFKVLSCSRLLNTGFDAPSVRCIIDCFPVKSVTTYVQRVGRLMRIFEGKEYGIYLDHASNFGRFGYAEDIVPESLHDGTKPHNEKEQTTDDKKPLVTKECPECMQQMSGRLCKACGYAVPSNEYHEDDGTMLVELSGNKANRTDDKKVKDQFYSELFQYAKTKDYKPGWAAMQYKEKYGLFPDNIVAHETKSIELAKGWVKHKAIKRRYSEKAGAETIKKLKESFN